MKIKDIFLEHIKKAEQKFIPDTDIEFDETEIDEAQFENKDGLFWIVDLPNGSVISHEIKLYTKKAMTK